MNSSNKTLELEQDWTFYGYSLIAIVIVITNVALITVIVRNKHLHTVTNILIGNLAVSDLSVGCIGIPLILAARVTNSRENIQLCLFFLSFSDHQIILPSAIFTIVAIDRYIFIMKPLRYNTIVSRRRIIKCMIMTDVIAFIWAFLPLFGWNKLSNGLTTADQLTRCVPEQIFTRNYFILTIIIAAFHIGIQITSFSIITWIVSKQAARINLEYTRSSQSQATRSTNRRATVILVVMVLMAAIGWFPVLLFSTLMATERLAIDLMVLLALSTSVVNPLLYGFGTPAVRKAAQQMIMQNRISVARTNGVPLRLM